MLFSKGSELAFRLRKKRQVFRFENCKHLKNMSVFFFITFFLQELLWWPRQNGGTDLLTSFGVSFVECCHQKHCFMLGFSSPERIRFAKKNVQHMTAINHFLVSTSFVNACIRKRSINSSFSSCHNE